MLYQRAKEPELLKELFENPPAAYRGAPFWAWNCALQEDLLIREIGQMKEMGMGGFHIHCRVGLDTEYLGQAFFDLVKRCEEEAKRQNMLCYLYDEDRWPSGSAGGIVTKEKQFRTRFLVFEPDDLKETADEAYMAAAKAVRGKERTLLGRYKINLDAEGYMISYEMVDEMTKGADIWRAYLELSGDTPWFNNEAYVNTLDKAAIDRFIEVTHEAYYQRLQGGFGKDIPAIFTDEPQTVHKEMLKDPFSREPVIFPFTDDFDKTFRETYAVSIIAHLPELIWEQKEKPVSHIRYAYHAHVNDRFSEAFGDNIGNWCKEHGIALTGHMMNEWTLHSQTMAAGEVMRGMAKFGMPGIDMLCDSREFSTAKQAQSIANQNGAEGVMSELYGVTGWNFDFRGHKLAGDWQAALGVTLRVPHLTWVSMEGEAKRDYPASIGYQSPWYKEYSYIENHFARVNTALTRGNAHVRIGVIHPVESYWLYWGNQKQTALVRQVLEKNFEELIEWLLFGLLDFDFISEAVLEEETTAQEDDKFHMGAMAYDMVIVPACHTLRSHTLKRLSLFAKSGGTVLFMGEPPKYVDGKASDAPSALAKQGTVIAYERGSLLEAVEPLREVDVTVHGVDGNDPTKVKHRESGTRASNLFYRMRDDGAAKWLFICHVNKPVNPHITFTEEWDITVKGHYKVTVYDTMTGEIYETKAVHQGNTTRMTHYCSQHDSLLLYLQPATEEACGRSRESSLKLPGEVCYLPQPRKYRLEEENVLLLDLAEYAFDRGEWQPEEEILRIDNQFRERLQMPLRMEALAQPWTCQEKEVISHELNLRFVIESELEVEGAMLAMEHPEKATITVNSEVIPYKEEGFFVDESIKKTALPKLLKGMNVLELSIPFGQKTNVEWCYLLGRFGVQVSGRKKKIIAPEAQLFYGDYTRQGLPFYAGNLTYEVELACKEGELNLELSHYSGALMQVWLDGKKIGNVAFAPYRICCGQVERGTHLLQIKLFGNRQNAFGPLHNADASERWIGPNAWRTKGAKWSYEYQLKEMGILTTPVYWVEEKKEKNR